MLITNNYIVATIKQWNINEFYKHSKSLPGEWSLITNNEDLKEVGINNINPRYIFFPHWSWKVASDLIDKFECVCFHMTDVPYGRGGSPLQNLITAKKKKTVLTALRMTEELDAGPVYLKKSLSLEGSAQEIFERAAVVAFDMINEIVNNEPDPVEQVGNPTYFDRRKPEQSCMPADGSILNAYDHIRMLDAETYPHAFIQHGNLRIEFTNAEINDGEIMASVRIVERNK